MTKTVSYSYQMEGHETLYNADLDFYWSLPERKEEYWEQDKDISGHVTRSRSIPRPDPITALIASGTAILSSAGLASAIKAYLLRHKTKISIKDRASQIEVVYEGPRLKEAAAEINGVLETMSEYLDLRAEKLPRARRKPPTTQK
jgi:hypothetical protein